MDDNKKISLLSEKIKNLKSELDFTLQQKEDLELKNRSFEEEISQLNFNNDNLKKRFEALQNELTQAKEKKKSGMLDWVMSSSVKDENSELKNRLLLLENELDIKIKENEDLHSSIFDIKFSLEQKLEQLELKINTLSSENEIGKGKLTTVSNTLKEKERENDSLIKSVSSLKEKAKELKTELGGKISYLEIKNNEIIEKNKNLKYTISNTSFFDEYRNPDYNKLDLPKDRLLKTNTKRNVKYESKYSSSNENQFVNMLINNQVSDDDTACNHDSFVIINPETLEMKMNNFNHIIETLGQLEVKFITFSEASDMFKKQFTILKDIKSDDLTIKALVTVYNKLSEYFGLLNFNYSMCFHLFSEIKSLLINFNNELKTFSSKAFDSMNKNKDKDFNKTNINNSDGGSDISQELTQEYNKSFSIFKTKLTLMLKTLISVLINSFSYLKLTLNYLESKIFTELKLFSNSEIYDTLQDSNTTLNKVISNLNKKISQLKILLFDFQEFFVSFTSNSNSSSWIIKYNEDCYSKYDIQNFISCFGDLKSSSNKMENLFFNIIKNLINIDLSYLLESMIVSQINLGVSLTILIQENNENEITDFNCSLYEGLLNHDRDYFLDLMKIKNLGDRRVPSISESKISSDISDSINNISGLNSSALSKFNELYSSSINNINENLNSNYDSKNSGSLINNQSYSELKNILFFTYNFDLVRKQYKMISSITLQSIVFLNYLNNISQGVEYKEGLTLSNQDTSNEILVNQMSQKLNQLRKQIEENEYIIKEKEDVIETLQIELEADTNHVCNTCNNDNTNYSSVNVSQVTAVSLNNETTCSIFSLLDKEDNNTIKDLINQDKYQDSNDSIRISSFVKDVYSALLKFSQKSYINSQLSSGNYSNIAIGLLNNLIPNKENSEGQGINNEFKNKYEDLELKYKELDVQYKIEVENKEGYMKNVSTYL